MVLVKFHELNVESEKIMLSGLYYGTWSFGWLLSTSEIGTLLDTALYINAPLNPNFNHYYNTDSCYNCLWIHRIVRPPERTRKP